MSGVICAARGRSLAQPTAFRPHGGAAGGAGVVPAATSPLPDSCVLAGPPASVTGAQALQVAKDWQVLVKK